MGNLRFRLIGGFHAWLYRLFGGRFVGRYGKAPILLLTSTGRRSGEPRTVPLLYVPDGEPLALIASKGGDPRHPSWYLNLRAHPEADVTVGAERRRVRARDAEGEERDRLWARAVELYPAYAKYEQKTSRRIPVVVLEPT